MPGIPLSANFDLGTGIPLDSRLVQADITARNALNTVTQRYEGMAVFVVATQKNYQLRGGVADGNWTEVTEGVTPTNGVFEWVTNKYQPYAAAGAGVFDTSSTFPTGTTRLNYGGYLYATRHYGDLYTPDGSMQHLTISAGNASGAAGTDAGNLTLKAGDSINADAGSQAGYVFIVPGNPNNYGTVAPIYLGNASFNGSTIGISALGTRTDVTISISPKGAGFVTLGTGSTNVFVSGILNVSSYIYTSSDLTFGGARDAMLSGAPGIPTHVAGYVLTIKGGLGYTGSGNNNGGNLILGGGDPYGSGTRGNVYFGSGAAGYLPAKSTETNIIYYDTATGKISYGVGASTGEPALGNPGVNGYVLSSTTAGVRSWIAAGGGMTYPAAGIANSTGSAWTTSYTVTGTGTVVALQTGPAFLTTISITAASPYITLATYSAGTEGAPLHRKLMVNKYTGAESGSIDFLDMSQEDTRVDIVFSSMHNNGTVYEDLRIKNGNVGIGTTAPVGLLHIGAVTATPPTYRGQLIVTNGIGTAGPQQAGGIELVQADANNGYGMKLYTNSASNQCGIATRHNSTTWTERISIATSTGNVGIGTTTPNYKLTVMGGTLDSMIYLHAYSGGMPDGHLVLFASEPAKTYNGVGISNNWRWDGSNWSRIDTSVGGCYIAMREVEFNIYVVSAAGADNLRLRCNASGVSIYDNLVAQGTVTATNFILSSDETLKTKISSFVPYPIKIKYHKFEFKSEPGITRYGFIAQEVQKDYPEFVREDSGGILSLSYTDIMLRKIAYLEWKVEQLEKKLK